MNPVAFFAGHVLCVEILIEKNSAEIDFILWE